MNRNHMLAMAALVLISGHATAATVACPAASDIKQAGNSADGTQYTAATGGHTWKGEVSKYDDDVDLKTLHFVGAAIAKAKKFVACDYYDSGKSNLRMTIDTTQYAPASKAAWSEGDPSVCNKSDVTQCELN